MAKDTTFHAILFFKMISLRCLPPVLTHSFSLWDFPLFHTISWLFSCEEVVGEVVWDILDSQYLKFCLLTLADKWKCASSVIIRRLRFSSVRRRNWSAKFRLRSKSSSLSFGQGWKCSSWWRILRTLHDDKPSAMACLLADLSALRITALLTASIFSGVRAFWTDPGGFFFCAEAVSRKFLIHNFIVLELGTAPWRGTLNSLRNRRWVVITESPLLKMHPLQKHDVVLSKLPL